MIIVIPLGGLGLRFKKLNYKLPKPLINVMGKPILYWLLDNLNFESINFVIIPYNSELSDYLFEEKLLKDLGYKVNFFNELEEIDTYIDLSPDNLYYFNHYITTLDLSNDSPWIQLVGYIGSGTHDNEINFVH